MKKKKRKTPRQIRAKAETLAAKWFNRCEYCVMSGWDGLEKYDAVDCRPSFRSNSGIEWAHIISRAQSSINKLSPMNGLPLCGGHHDLYDRMGQAKREFMADMFPGRIEMLEAKDLERHLSGYNKYDLQEENEHWLKWYESRPEDETWADWDGEL